LSQTSNAFVTSRPATPEFEERWFARAEMRPPFEVELWKPVDDTRHILAVTASFEAAEKAYQEAVANLRLGEVVRLRDAVGTLLLSTDANE
jgi:hypothetical protein